MFLSGLISSDDKAKMKINPRIFLYGAGKVTSRLSPAPFLFLLFLLRMDPVTHVRTDVWMYGWMIPAALSHDVMSR